MILNRYLNDTSAYLVYLVILSTTKSHLSDCTELWNVSDQNILGIAMSSAKFTQILSLQIVMQHVLALDSYLGGLPFVAPNSLSLSLNNLTNYKSVAFRSLIILIWQHFHIQILSIRNLDDFLWENSQFLMQ